jgi:hypothetical protein
MKIVLTKQSAISDNDNTTFAETLKVSSGRGPDLLGAKPLGLFSSQS